LIWPEALNRSRQSNPHFGKNARNYLPFISGDATSGDFISVMQLPVTSFPVMQLPVTSLLHTAPPQMRFELCLYTTDPSKINSMMIVL
jgi:hypothetical protein